MESSLFNPGFIGSSFHWFIGQVADDSTWRENLNPDKFEKTEDIPGWGYRYKVRIIAHHDQNESDIKAEELPWAQVMYPCLLYTSPSPRDVEESRMPSSA